MSTALVFGATGVSANALIEVLLSEPSSKWRKVIGVSRRQPTTGIINNDKYKHISIDLLSSPQEIGQKLGSDNDAISATHVFFYSYIAKDDEDDLIETNRKLLVNTIDAIGQHCKQVNKFMLQTGYKYYGAFLGGDKLSPYPWIENAERYDGKNFYFVQEDDLKNKAQEYGWNWVVTRPNFITGVSKGNFMSIAVTIALYATLCKTLNQPFYFPGSRYSYNLIYDHSNARNNAEFSSFAINNPAAHNKAFNIHDGPKNTFADLWPRIAQYFGLELPQPVAHDVKVEPLNDLKVGYSTNDFANKHKNEFANIVKKYGLDPQAFDYATWTFLDLAVSRSWPDQGSLELAHSIGWNQQIDSYEDGYKKAFDELKTLNIIPNKF